MSGKLFFKLWYGPCSFSKMIFSRRTTCLCFFDHIVLFLHLFELKKTRIEFLRKSVRISVRELRLRPFRAFLDDVGTKTTHAKAEV